MEGDDYIEEIRSFILKNKKPSYTTTSKKEIRVRCPYCGDSTKNPSAAHMYIEMKPPFRFHCFKCETSGVLNAQVFRDLGLDDQEPQAAVINANKNLKKEPGSAKILSKKKKLRDAIVDTPTSQAAVAYFNSRYNFELTNEYISKKFKCVTDPIEFFKANNIYAPKNNQFDFTGAIGFVSGDASHIIFRDIAGRSAQRYYNLNLLPANELGLGSKSYMISGEVDAMAEEVTLVITEGIFDIIGVYEHFFKDRDKKNVIFAAACGKAYAAVILSVIRLGFLNLKIVIFSDGDVDLNFYRRLKRESPYLRDSQLTIFYNNLYNPETGFGKDFGVPKSEIALRKVII